MNHIPSYQESSYAVHQRYEDTSLVIFHQLQKSKKGGAHSASSGTRGTQFKFSHGGGVVVRSDTAMSSPVKSAGHVTPQSKSKHRSAKKFTEMAVELHPILEVDIRPSKKWWYVLSISGKGPSVRVGHTATFVRALNEDEHDRVFVIGGANPEQVFSEVHILDLHLRSWETIEAPGFRGRYEHSAFRVENHPEAIFVFGGATPSGTLNDVQRLDVSSGVWSNVEVAGTSPAPRTHHTSAVIGPKVYFYSGGHSGADPVGDRQVHCLDTSTMTWVVITPSGDSPKPRHGHLMVALNNCIFLHGGMSGAAFYDDLFILDLDLNSWMSVKKKKTSPSPRAAHSGVTHDNGVYLFGGMNKTGALDEGYKLNAENKIWSKMDIEGPAPPNRLDFAMCTIKLRVPVLRPDSPLELQKVLESAHSQDLQALDNKMAPQSDGSRDLTSNGATGDEAVYTQDTDICAQGQQAHNTSQCTRADNERKQGTELETEEVSLILINGGMDTEGEIFDDTMVLML